MSRSLLEVLEAEGSWVTAERAAMEAGMNDETAKRSLHRLKNDGKVETVYRDGRNLWRYVTGAIPDVTEEQVIPTQKRCSRCKEAKPLREFGKNRSAPDGHTYYCKPCDRERAAEYKARKAAKKSKPAEKADPPKGTLNGWRDVFANPTLSQLEQLRELVGVSSLDEAAAVSRAIAGDDG